LSLSSFFFFAFMMLGSVAYLWRAEARIEQRRGPVHVPVHVLVHVRRAGVGAWRAAAR